MKHLSKKMFSYLALASCLATSSLSPYNLLDHTLHQLIGTARLGMNAQSDIATRILGELCKNPTNAYTPTAVQATLNWGANPASLHNGTSCAELLAGFEGEPAAELTRLLLQDQALPADKRPERYCQPALCVLVGNPGDNALPSPLHIQSILTSPDTEAHMGQEERKMLTVVGSGDLATYAEFCKRIIPTITTETKVSDDGRTRERTTFDYEGLYKVVWCAGVCLLAAPPTRERVETFKQIFNLAAQYAVLPESEKDTTYVMFDLKQVVAPKILCDQNQPLLHRLVTLLPHEYQGATDEAPRHFSLLIEYLVKSGENINTLNSNKKTMFDIVVDVALHRDVVARQENNDDCTLYRRPRALLHSPRIGVHNDRTASIAATAFLVSLGCRHGIGYLRNTKRQVLVGNANATHVAQLFCTSPNTTLIDSLLAHDDESAQSLCAALAKNNQLGEFLEALVRSGNTALLPMVAEHNKKLIHSLSTRLWHVCATGIYHGTASCDTAQDLINFSVPINRRAQSGLTPLHHAVEFANKAGAEGHASLQLVRILVTQGASVSARDHAGRTPLAMAEAHVKALLTI